MDLLTVQAWMVVGGEGLDFGALQARVACLVTANVVIPTPQAHPNFCYGHCQRFFMKADISILECTINDLQQKASGERTAKEKITRSPV